MKTWLYLLPLVVLLFIRCGQRHNSTARSLPFADSLLKYDDGQNDTVVKCFGWIDSVEGALFITHIDTKRVAVIALADTTSYCYVKTGHNWQLCDSFRGDIYAQTAWATDLNGDGYEDIRISYGVMRGNNVCLSLLYRPQSGTLQHNPAFDLMNIAYDTATKRVRSSGLGGIYDNVKELYSVKGDSLQFSKSVEMNIGAEGRYGELSFYEQVNGTKKLIRTVKASGNQTAQNFDTALWTEDLRYFDRGRQLF